MALFSIESLKVMFETPLGTAHAVRGVDLAVDEGRIVGIVGESGSGKSMLFLAALGACGSQRPRRRSGRVRWNGPNRAAGQWR